jgi:hypothetical protein
LTIAGDPTVSVRCIPANRKSKELEVFTVGLSDHRLATPDFPRACTELHLRLPPDWPPGLPGRRHHQQRRPVHRARHHQRRGHPGRRRRPHVGQHPEHRRLVQPGPADQLHRPRHPRQQRHHLHRQRDGAANGYSELAAIGESGAVRSLTVQDGAGIEELVRRLEARGLPTWVDPRRPNVA